MMPPHCPIPAPKPLPLPEGEDELAEAAGNSTSTYNARGTLRRKCSQRKDFVLSIEGLHVAVHGTCKRQSTELLRGVSAELSSGQMLAIIGSSGAGKTTLLNALVKGGKGIGMVCSGRMLYNGQEISRQLFQAVGSYVEQVDASWPTMTVQQSLRFAASLYQGRTSRAWRDSIVEATLDEMGLTSCQHVLVGDGVLVQGISGGQRRRLSIAVELMKRPSLLVLDEPTSGLDSAAAEAIIDLLASYVLDHNIGILFTVHQPSSYTFRRFNQLLVLAAGRVCYFGPAGQVLTHFELLGHACESGVNPAEFILRKTNSDFCSCEEVQQLCDAWERKGVAIVFREDACLHREDACLHKEDACLHKEQREGASWIHQSSLLWYRAVLGHLRNPALVTGRIIFGAIGVAFIMFAYIEARARRQEDVLDRIWAVMWLQQLPGFLVVGTIPTFVQEGVCLQRELQNGMVGPWNYLLADFLANVPLWFLISLLSILPGFAILDMNWSSFPHIWLLVAAYVGMCHNAAQLWGALFKNAALSTVAFISQTIMNMIFNGNMLAHVERLHWSIRWLSVVMPSKYSFRSGALLEFRGLTFEGFEQCLTEQRIGSPCWGHKGIDIIDALSRAMFPVLTPRDTFTHDLGVIALWIVAFKAVHVLVFLRSGA